MKTEDVQILFADLQPRLVAGSQTVAPDRLSLAASVLAKVAGILHLPVTFSVTSHGGEPADLIPELAEFATQEATFWRGPAGPFLDPATAAALKGTGRKTLVISGFASEVVVLHAALDAIGAGYSVQLPLDAVGGMSERTESAALRQIERAGGVATSVWSLISRLEPDFQHPPGSEAFAAMQPLRPGFG
jgi:hypothetical protein